MKMKFNEINNKRIPAFFFTVLLLLICSIPGPGSAAPACGAAFDITSNNATIPVSGATGTFFVQYGIGSGQEIWFSNNVTSGTGSADVTIWGAPLIGGQGYYAQACDDSGCGNEISFTMDQITPVPTRNYDSSYNKIIVSHWDFTMLLTFFFEAFTRDVPATVIYGIIFGSIIIGFWRRTKSVRLISVIMIFISPLVISQKSGLMMGMPLQMQSLGAVLFTVGLAGILLSFIKKS